MEFLKKIGNTILTGLVALAVLIGAISWWSADPATRHAILANSGHILAWSAIVLLVPWATFFIISAVNRLDSNAAGAGLVGAYTLLELIWLAWLVGFRFGGIAAVSGMVVALLFAGVYNVFACDWIAEKV